MSTIYDIPRTTQLHGGVRHIEDEARDHSFGDVDYGPNYGFQSTFTLDSDYSAAEAAALIGDELAFDYQDNFRQIEVVSPGPEPRTWIAKVHIAWGDRPYYTPVTP